MPSWTQSISIKYEQLYECKICHKTFFAYPHNNSCPHCYLSRRSSQ